MRSMRFKIAFISLLLLMTSAGFGMDNSLNWNNIKRAISARETHQNYRSIGGAGERSQYQFLQSTWEMFSKVPFRHASEKAYQKEVERVADLYLRSIVDALTKERLPITAHNVALRWTCGVHAQHYKIPKWFYANDVEALYNSYHR